MSENGKRLLASMAEKEPHLEEADRAYLMGYIEGVAAQKERAEKEVNQDDNPNDHPNTGR
jgi:hypothetical protein